MLLNKYISFTSKYPISTAAITGGLFSLLGDGLVQYMFRKSEDYMDYNRSILLTIYGIAYRGIGQHFIYNQIMPKLTNNSPLGILCLDQLFYMPLIYIPFFYLTMGSSGICRAGWHQFNFENCYQDLTSQYISTVVNGWALWVPTQIIAYSKYVNLKTRVLFYCTIGFCWNVIVSYRSNEGLR